MATKKLQVFRCMVCGKYRRVRSRGFRRARLLQPTDEIFVENTTDAAQEKTRPVVERIEGGYKVKVGEVLIRWREALHRVD